MDIIMESLSEASTNRSVIPESCLSFSEMSVYLDEFTNKEFNSMLESIGIDELSIFESTGSIVVYEAEKLETLKAKVTDYTKSIWSAYKGFWEKVLASVKADTKNAKKLGKLTAETVRHLNDEKVYGKTHTFFKATDIKFDSNARKFAHSVNKTFRAIATDDHESIKEAKNMLEDVICEKISEVDGKSNKVMKNNLSKKLVGKEINATGAWVKKHYSKIESTVSGAMLNNVKSAYNSEKKVFADIVSMCGTVDNTTSAIIDPWAKMLGTTVSVMHACYAVEMDVCKRELREYINIMTKVLGNKPVAESCEDISDCQTAEITGECPAAQEVEAGGANTDAMPDNKVEADAEGSEKDLEAAPEIGSNKVEDAAVSEGKIADKIKDRYSRDAVIDKTKSVLIKTIKDKGDLKANFRFSKGIANTKETGPYLSGKSNTFCLSATGQDAEDTKKIYDCIQKNEKAICEEINTTKYAVDKIEVDKHIDDLMHLVKIHVTIKDIDDVEESVSYSKQFDLIDKAFDF